MIRPQRRSPSLSLTPAGSTSCSPSNTSATSSSPRNKTSPSSLLIQTGNADGGGSPRIKTMTTRARRSTSPRKRLLGRRRRRKQGFVLWTPRSVLRVFTFAFVCSAFVVVLFLRRRKTSAAKHQQQQQEHGVSHPDNATTFRRNTPGAPPCKRLPSADHVDFTLVTQCSENRLWMMEYHCQRWNNAGPISVAVFTNRTAASVRHELTTLMGCNGGGGTAADKPSFLSVHTIAPNSSLSEQDYPVNLLRNTALSSVRTSHVVYVDIDFWESTNLPVTLQRHTARLAAEPRTALVLPAFQLNRQCKQWRECPENNVPVMPGTKKELLDLVYRQQASTFDPTNIGGHGSTRYMDWFDQTADELLPIECFKSNRYEPYLVFRYCRDLPPFQEAFTGYGKNKMTWVMQLRCMGWNFEQIGEGFIVHYPHLDSKARMHWNGGENGVQLQRPKTFKNEKGNVVDWLAFKRGQIDHTFVDFRRWLDENVPDESVVPMCPDALNDDVRLWIDNE